MLFLKKIISVQILIKRLLTKVRHLICLFNLSKLNIYSCYNRSIVFLCEIAFFLKRKNKKQKTKPKKKKKKPEILIERFYLKQHTWYAFFNMNTYICAFFLLVGHKPNHFHLVFLNFSLFLLFAFWKSGTNLKKMGQRGGSGWRARSHPTTAPLLLYGHVNSNHSAKLSGNIFFL